MKNYKITNKYFMASIFLVSELVFIPQPKAASINELELQDDNKVNFNTTEPKTLDSDALELFTQNPEDLKIVSVIDHIKYHRFDNAHEEISKLLKENPKNPTLYNLQALAYDQEKKQDFAKDSFKKALELDGKNIVALHGIASIALEENQSQEAKDYFNKILQVDNNYVKAYVSLAYIAITESDKAKAESLLKIAYDKTRSEFKPHLAIAKELLKLYASEEQNVEIKKLSAEFAKEYPDNSESFAFEINALLLTNQQDQAEKRLRDMISRKPDEIIHRIALASLIRKVPGREKEVINIADQIIALNPEKLQAYILKANYLLEQKQYPQAIELADQIQKLFPKFTVGEQLKGQIYFAAGETNKAIEAYQNANKIQPDSKLYLIMADLLNKQGKTKEAIALISQALEKKPDQTNLRVGLAVFLQQLGDTTQAKENYKAALKQDPANLIALNNLANLYITENDPQSVKLAQSAYKLNPKSLTTIDTFGYSLIKTGQFDQGLALLQKAIISAPKATFIQVHLAEGLALSNHKSDAVKILDTLLSENKDFPEKDEVLKLLNTLK